MDRNPFTHLTDEERSAGAPALRRLLDDERAWRALRSRCMRRAKKRWKAAHPDTDIWPDGADNIVWLLERLDRVEADCKALQDTQQQLVKALEAVEHVYLTDPDGPYLECPWCGFGGPPGGHWQFHGPDCQRQVALDAASSKEDDD